MSKRKEKGETEAKEPKAKKQKIVCPLDVKEFLANAKPLEVLWECISTRSLKRRFLQIKIGDQVLEAQPKQNKTGSFGWSVSGVKARITIRVGDKDVPCQATINITAMKSAPSKAKKSKEEEEEAGEEEEGDE